MLRKTLRQILLLSMALAPNIVGFADASFAQKPTAQPPQQAFPAPIEKTLAWLPIDTESVVVARSFKIPNDTDKGAFKGVAEKEPAEAAATALRLLAMGPISYMKNGKYTDPLAGKKVVLALGAARRFHHATLFGRDRYQGCHVLIFEDELGAAGDRMTELLRKDAMAIHSVEGYETYVFSSDFVKESVFKDKDKDWEGMFIVRPQPNVVLCATQKTFLKEVLRRRKMKPATVRYHSGCPYGSMSIVTLRHGWFGTSRSEARLTMPLPCSPTNEMNSKSSTSQQTRIFRNGR